MLVAFHSSPFSAPLQSNIPNRGFELDVDMFFVDSDSHDYAQGPKGICEFNINASNTGKFFFSFHLFFFCLQSNLLPTNVFCFCVHVLHCNAYRTYIFMALEATKLFVKRNNVP